MKFKEHEARTEIKFLAVVPVPVDEKLREEARREKRSRQAQLARILEERYGLVQTSESVAA